MNEYRRNANEDELQENLVQFSIDDIVREFSGAFDHWSGPIRNAVSEEDIRHCLEGATLIASIYETEWYEGRAFVLYEKDGKLYEVNGCHCSWHGLEGQWEPSRTTWGAIAMRKFGGIGCHEWHSALTALIKDRIKEQVL
jgi:hypothetical protein